MSEHELWNELGNLYFMSGAYDQAIHAYTRAITLEAGFGQPYSNLALVYVQKGKYDEAIELYRRSIELLADNKEKAISWNRLGHLHRQLKEYHQAVVAYQQADQLDPESDENREEPGQEAGPLSLVQVEESPDLEEELAPLADELPADHPDAAQEPIPVSLEWAVDLREDELLPGPAASAETGEAPDQAALSLFSDPAADWHPLPAPEAAEMTEEPWAEAPTEQEQESYYFHPAAEDFAVPDPVPESGGRLAQLDVVEARPAALLISQAIEAPAQAESAADELDRLEMDIARFKRVVQVNTRNAFAWDTLGGLYKAGGRYKEAIMAYQQAISIDSGKAFYYYHLGLVYAAEGRIEDAIATFQKVVELDPGHSLAHATLAGYYRKMDLEELAQRHIEKALSNFNTEENEYNHACLQAICGNVDRAIELLEIALKNKQTIVDWVLRDPDLDFVRADPRFQALVERYRQESES